MDEASRRLIGPSRRWLSQGWHLAAGDGRDDAPPGESAAWIPIDEPLPVAAALTSAGLWNLDQPNRQLDSEVWFYRLEFDAPPGRGDAWTLGFDGLATVADVWLNGRHVLSSRNMFRSHELAVGSLLRPQGNLLLLKFDSLDALLNERRPRPRWRVPMLKHQQLRWFRTTLLGRTPGWSPPSPVIGLWKGVWLESADVLNVKLQRLDCRIERDAGIVQATLVIAGVVLRAARLVVARGDKVFSAALALNDEGHHVGRIEIPEVERWWPHTHGEPCLYRASVEIDTPDGGTMVLPLPAIGFRTLMLDRSGGGFSLCVNDVPVFCRGACWTPLDTLRLHADTLAYGNVLAKVRAAGMNMLRVGGTMVYEEEAFLAACDAAGVLVWQDFMFANMDYPADDPEFAAEVEAEVAEQMARWQGHACVAVVCGNSEVEQQAAMWGADRALWEPPLFHEVLARLAADALPDTPWWPSSAHGGDFPFQPAAGTCSYYGVGAYQRAIDDARDGGVRFATECLAFANIPSDDALGRIPNALPSLHAKQPAWSARVPRDLGAGWDFDDVRDHYVQRLFGECAAEVRRTDPQRYLALGRAATGEAMFQAFTRWRAAGSRCSGALVWFLRDLWPAIGWGLLDDAGQPKPAFHMLTRVLQPVHVGITDDGSNGLSLHLVNERAEALEAELEFTLYRDGEFPAGQWRRSVVLAGRECRRIAATDGLPGFIDVNWAYRFGPPMADVALATLTQRRPNGQEIELSRAVIRLGDQPAFRNTDIGLQGRAVRIDETCVEITVQTRAMAWGVHLDAPGWTVDDEFFHLTPGACRTLRLTSISPANTTWRVTMAALNSRATVLPMANG